MRLKSYSSEGVVLSRKNYSEADRILSVLTKNYGKVRLLAKGVRKPKSKKRGHIEVFSKIKFSANKSKGIDFLTEVELLDSYQGIRSNLRKASLAYYFCEVIEKTMQEEDRNQLVFQTLVTNLDNIKNTGKLKRLRKDFVLKTLVLQGFIPNINNRENIDSILSNIMEYELSSVRVGKKVLT
jgi:DNA repair protein RecO (recombination protein O)